MRDEEPSVGQDQGELVHRCRYKPPIVTKQGFLTPTLGIASAPSVRLYLPPLQTLARLPVFAQLRLWTHGSHSTRPTMEHSTSSAGSEDSTGNRPKSLDAISL